MGLEDHKDIIGKKYHGVVPFQTSEPGYFIAVEPYGPQFTSYECRWDTTPEDEKLGILGSAATLTLPNTEMPEMQRVFQVADVRELVQKPCQVYIFHNSIIGIGPRIDESGK